MIHRAVIERDMSTGGDPYGQPLPPSWQVLYAALPCYFWTEAERELEGRVNAIVSDHRLLVPKGADVEQGDRVVAVQDRLGQPLLQRAMAVAGVLPRRDHKVLLLEGVA